MTEKLPLLLRGMHGLGDNIHQRALVRSLLPENKIWLETSWPCVYHDFVDEGLLFIRRPVALRAQLKNAQREAAKFTAAPRVQLRTAHNTYNVSTIKASPSHTVMEAMYRACGILKKYPEADYSLPIPPLWADAADKLIDLMKPTKPICVYRPLSVRQEFRASALRNANAKQYAELFTMMRDTFHVVSLADLEDNREWIVGPQLRPDATFNKGELTFEIVAALTARAKLAFCSGGFMAILAPAVKTPCLDVAGGYEPTGWLADGTKYAPWVGIDTLKPCECGHGSCLARCTKEIDMGMARTKSHELLTTLGVTPLINPRPFDEIFAPPERADSAPTPQQHVLRQRMPFPQRFSKPGVPRLPGVVRT